MTRTTNPNKYPCLALLFAVWTLTGLLMVSMAQDPQGPSPRPEDPQIVLDAIAQYVFDHPELKPITRKCLSPDVSFQSELMFQGQAGLKRPLLEAYLDRAIVHMNLWDERSRRFLEESGTKYVHWADLGWNRVYTPEDWIKLTASVDAIHDTPWGCDISFECGVMEAVSRSRTSGFKIPPWYRVVLNATGLQQQRRYGPQGPEYFNYEAMLDREAADWPANFLGLWGKSETDESGPPDITMLETQIYYAYLMSEYLDAGFEGVMFGQSMMTGARDTGHRALHALTRFASQWADRRAYRGAVALTSHVIEIPTWPVPETGQARPLYTHVTWPMRLSYTDEEPFGMHFGPEAKATPNRQGGEEIVRLLQLPGDLPILLEIDNYGKNAGPSTVCDEGYDEITAFAAKPPKDRCAFLEHYYFASRDWRNSEGHGRVHIALPGNRVINVPLSLANDAEGKPLPPVRAYKPFAENGGDEAIIGELFKQARTPENFEDMENGKHSEPYIKKK